MVILCGYMYVVICMLLYVSGYMYVVICMWLYVCGYMYVAICMYVVIGYVINGYTSMATYNQPHDHQKPQCKLIIVGFYISILSISKLYIIII